MVNPNLIRTQDEKIIQKILYERPISALYSRQIGILAGPHAKLKKISDCYQIIHLLSHRPMLIAEASLAEFNLPVELYLQANTKSHLSYANTDEALALISGCQLLIAGMDLELNSQMQLFMEKLIESRVGTVVFTTESIPLFATSAGILQGRTGDIFVCNTRELLHLAQYLGIDPKFSSNAGIYNKLAVLELLASHLRAHIVCVENNQVLSMSYNKHTVAGIINYENAKGIDFSSYFVSILSALVADSTAADTDMFERIFTAGQLLKQCLQGKDFFAELKKAFS